MTVKELMKHLEQFPCDAEVVVDVQTEAGFYDDPPKGVVGNISIVDRDIIGGRVRLSGHKV